MLKRVKVTTDAYAALAARSRTSPHFRKAKRASNTEISIISFPDGIETVGIVKSNKRRLSAAGESGQGEYILQDQ